jgi:hypothetical protein
VRSRPRNALELKMADHLRHDRLDPSGPALAAHETVSPRGRFAPESGRFTSQCRGTGVAPSPRWRPVSISAALPGSARR